MSRDEKTLDEALCREVAKRLGRLTLVETVRVFPPRKPDAVVSEFGSAYYPDSVRTVELECRAYTNGDFTIVYRERWSDEAWMTRWDRHENPHNARDHRHEPPRARTEDAVDASYPDDFFAVLERVLGEIDDRLGDVWEQDS